MKFYKELYAMTMTEGCGMHDSMYCIHGKGVSGLEPIDGFDKVEKMVKKYEDKKCISINILKGGSEPYLVLNIA